MKKQTKILIGLGVAAIGAYILFNKKKKPVTDYSVTCNDGTKDVSNGIAAPCLNNGGVAGQESKVVAESSLSDTEIKQICMDYVDKNFPPNPLARYDTNSILDACFEAKGEGYTIA